MVEENLLVEMRDVFSKINRAEWWGEGTKMERLYLLNAPLLEQKKDQMMPLPPKLTWDQWRRRFGHLLRRWSALQ